MRSKVILTEYKHDIKKGEKFEKYHVEHTSFYTKLTLEQNVTVHTDRYGHRKLDVALDDFPQGLSDRETMLKLADWLHRLGVAIEDHWGTP